MLGRPVVGTFRVQEGRRVGGPTPAVDPLNSSPQRPRPIWTSTRFDGLRILLAHNNVETPTSPLTARAATHVRRPKPSPDSALTKIIHAQQDSWGLDKNNSRLRALRTHQVKGLRIDNR
jgi:hypothetical protein